MGCGSSKSVQIADAPNPEPVKKADSAVDVSKPEPAPVQAAPSQKSLRPITPPTKPSARESDRSSPDSGLDQDKPDLASVSTKKAPLPPKKTVDPADESDNEVEAACHVGRETSATSTRSAPVIMERPSSRGGSAFDISFDGPAPADNPGLPRRLKTLDQSRKRRADLTLEELQAKLNAAETRRKELEAKLREKLAAETKKPETYTQSLNTSLNESVEKIQSDVDQKLKSTSENREAHLKQLRDRLKAKEDRARQVREKKRQLAALNASQSTPAVLA
eukprot:m.82017 g.82017  ORF g.82017 m.82017 type:complete len:277 (+) comp8098_c1_seq1:82-912(+)